MVYESFSSGSQATTLQSDDNRKMIFTVAIQGKKKTCRHLNNSQIQLSPKMKVAPLVSP